MRRTSFLALTSGLAIAGLAVHAAGCGTQAADCDLGLTCPGYADAGPQAHDGSGGGGDAGSDAPIIDCTQPPNLMSGGPDTSCGVFAAPSNKTGGDGSKLAPFATLQLAVNKAAIEGKPVFACDQQFAENLHVPSGVTIFGGLDCSKDWAFTAGKRTLVNAPGGAAASGGSEIAVLLAAGTGKTVIADVDVMAPGGAAPGVSSIAVLIDDTAAELTRSTLTAANGTKGEDGASLVSDPALDGVDGVLGYNICGADATNPAPMGPTKTCGAQASAGGRGGDGGPPSGAILNGGDGQPGTPQDLSAPAAGLPGTGQSTVACTAGVQGADGAAGPPGDGATGKGALSASGYVGSNGSDGIDGKPGQGGGGGGGAKGKLQIVCTGLQTKDRAGATGGSGGTGGCGGARGGGGKAGGSSIALLSLATHAVTLTSVVLNVGGGGDGGHGGDGQKGGSNGSGALGGQGANGTGAGCTGGGGGLGGDGGPGAGGIGGHAVGVAFKGTAPKGAPVVHFKATPGLGGAPGTGSTAAMGAGAAGVTGDLVDFGP